MIYGEYTVYILGAYCVAGILLGGLCAISIVQYRRAVNRAMSDNIRHNGHKPPQDRDDTSKPED